MHPWSGEAGCISRYSLSPFSDSVQVLPAGKVVTKVLYTEGFDFTVLKLSPVGFR